MSAIPAELRYTSDHEYVQRTDDPAVVSVGITDYAQGELGDIVFVTLPAVGSTIRAGEAFGTIEAVKAVSELFAPVTGEVVAANGALDADPAAINRDPYGEGWIIRVRLENPAALNGLLDADAYRRHLAE